MTYNPQKHHRRSIRLKGFDYTQAGAYFITLVTERREPLFGEITGGDIQLSPIGQIAEAHWRSIPDHFPQVELGNFVVMPNHLHGIIVIHHDPPPGGRGTPPGNNASWGRGTPWRAPTDGIEKFGKPVSGSLATIIRQYKSSVTRRIRMELNNTPWRAPIWQKNYYEHIIRDDEDHNRIRLYIEANIDAWAKDSENLASHK